MENLTLEEEFEKRKLEHILTVLNTKLIEYYETIMENQVNLPSFLGGDTPEKMAEEQIKDLLATDYKKLLKLYEIAYEDLAQRGEF